MLTTGVDCLVGGVEVGCQSACGKSLDSKEKQGKVFEEKSESRI